MAAIAITPLVLTTRDSTASNQLTWSTVTTAETSGAYLDLTGYKGDKVIIVADFTSTNVANSSLAATLRVQCSTTIKPSGYGKGDLGIECSSSPVALKGVCFQGPFDLSRFKDSNERITIKCTRGTNIAHMSAIIIE